MIENEFGTLVEKLIYFSGQKNFSLAMKLGYDVSYISKWINLSTIPTSKNINSINDIIANFVVESVSEESLNGLINYLEIETNDVQKIDEILTSKIKDELYKSYSYSYKKYNKKNSKKGNNNNSIQIINPSLRKQYLENEALEFIEKLGQSEIIMICNLFSLSSEDKVKISGIDKSVSDQENLSTDFMKVKYILSIDENSKNIVLDTISLITMATSSRRVNSEFYSCEFASETMIIAMKNIFVHTAIFINNKCLTTVTSHDEKVINDTYETLENIANTRGRKMFLLKTPQEMLIGEEYINYMMCEDLKWLIDEITELFMPSDLFLEVGQLVFGNSPEITSRLSKIDKVLQNITYNSKIDVILYKFVLKKYADNGNIKFFNQTVTLNIEQRKRHIENIKKLLEEKEDININLDGNSYLGDYKNNNERISLYMSQDISFLKEKFNGTSQNYLIIKETRLENILKEFFDFIWSDKDKENNKEEIKKLLLNHLRYIEILKKI
ncbi:MAG: hypothetical protein RSG52_13275 [Terrisporobacter sp.]|uniref:hypothetical protein n=1 Tax=Terrisporobacter sp. TaxID=1965305 RepID=UPI002FCCA9E4